MPIEDETPQPWPQDDSLPTWAERTHRPLNDGWSLKHQKRVTRAMRNGGNPDKIMKPHHNRGAK